MIQVTVGIADCRVSADRDTVLATYALGSCIAVLVHDPVAAVAGLLHYMLPDSSLDPGKAERNPFLFADTGIPRLIAAVCDCGARRERLVARIAGGAQTLNGHQRFQIGRRNQRAARRILREAGVAVRSEAVGAEVSRTVLLETGSGRALVRESGRESAAERSLR